MELVNSKKLSRGDAYGFEIANFSYSLPDNELTPGGRTLTSFAAGSDKADPGFGAGAAKQAVSL